MTKKYAFIVYSGINETGKAFHAMTHAKQAFEQKNISELYFAAEGTAWPAELTKKEHPMNALFESLQTSEVIQGACENCAIAFGNEETAKKEVGLIKGAECSYGQIDILGMEDQGYKVWIF